VHGLAELVDVDRHELELARVDDILGNEALGSHVDGDGAGSSGFLDHSGGSGGALLLAALLLAALVELNIDKLLVGLEEGNEQTSEDDAAGHREDDDESKNGWDSDQQNVDGGGVSDGNDILGVVFDVTNGGSLSVGDTLANLVDLVDNENVLVNLLRVLDNHNVLGSNIMSEVTVDRLGGLVSVRSGTGSSHVEVGQETGKGDDGEEEDDELNKLIHPVEAEHANVAGGGATHANIQDDNVDQRVDESHQGNGVVEDVPEEEERHHEHQGQDRQLEAHVREL